VEAFTERAEVSPPKTFARPRKWPCFIVVFAIILFLLCSGLGGGIFVFIAGARKSSPPYRMALEQVQTNPQVIEQLGQPIEDATILPAVNYDSGRASLDFDVAGPNGKAHVRAEARMIGGQWGLTSVEVNIDGGGHLSLDVSSGEGPSDAPAWTPNAGDATSLEDSATTPAEMKIEVDLPFDVDVQLPDIPKLPE
jgi:cytochrome oxidase complex assembly protein 1